MVMLGRRPVRNTNVREGSADQVNQYKQSKRQLGHIGSKFKSSFDYAQSELIENDFEQLWCKPETDLLCR